VAIHGEPLFRLIEENPVPSLRATACLLLFLGVGAVRAQEANKPIVNSIGMKLVLIPAGKFMMGSPAAEAERDPDELQHEVTITRPFYMGAYEVTQREFEKVGAKNMSFFKGGPDTPVDQVSWHNAVNFCQKLSALPEEKKAGRVYRLPTEAEWEYACRAGTTTPFAFGNALSSKEANFDGAYPYGGAPKGPNLLKPVKVGSYAPNAWGLYDMHGNVMEWCSDWYDPDYYKNSPAKDPRGPDKGVQETSFGKDFYHVVRGGCWLDEASGCRSAYRFRLQSTEPYRLVGLRVVCEVPKGKEP
jgi:formylglycine-generating enzyme required for sulfatase activity